MTEMGQYRDEKETLAKLCEVEVLLHNAIKDAAVLTYIASRLGEVDVVGLTLWTDRLNKKINDARTAMDWALFAVHGDKIVKSSEESESC